MFVHFPPDEKIGFPQEKKDDLFMEQKKMYYLCAVENVSFLPIHNGRT